jgi:hypothetical protein
MLVRQKVECWEAKYHEKSELEPRFRLQQHQQQQQHDVSILLQNKLNQTNAVLSVVDTVHYTITSRLDEPVWRLWQCSLEATARFCGPMCQVHIWLVSPDQEENNRLLQSLMLLVDHNKHQDHWCIHVPPNQTMVTGKNSNAALCRSPFSATAATTTSTTPTLAERLQTWLLQPDNAHSTLPAHLSDGWRIVTLLEYGSSSSSSSSLYLDADVVPISTRLFSSSLPENFIPMQNSIGSYKLNGGVLRLDSNNHANGAAASNGSNKDIFLQALANDYLEWAPLLAQHVPLEQQTFGFLGPAALTRTFLDLKDKSKVVLLPPHWVEPSTSNMDLCQRQSSSSNSVAIHWSGKDRKRNWMTASRQNACLNKVMVAACPIVLGA